MSNLSFNNIPSWLIQPTLLQNVFNNPFSSLKDVPSFTSLANNSSFSAGLRQALYWKKQLSPSTSTFTVIFSLLGPQGLILPNIQEVFQALLNVFNISNISEIYKASNSHFIGFTFTSASDASKFRSSFNYFSDCIVIHVPLPSHHVHHFKLLWLPPVFPDTRIHHFLNKYSIKHSFTRDLIFTGKNSFSHTNSVTGTLEISPDADINSLPYLIPLPSPHLGNAFFIIAGRPSFCLRCGQVGHVRRSCPTPRCSSCHKFHLTSTSCSSHDPALDFTSPDILSFDDADLTPASNTIHQCSSSLTLLSTHSDIHHSNGSSTTIHTPFIMPVSDSTSLQPIISAEPSCLSISNIFEHLPDEAAEVAIAHPSEPKSSVLILPDDSSAITLTPATTATSLASSVPNIQHFISHGHDMSDISVDLTSESFSSSSLSPNRKKFCSSSLRSECSSLTTVSGSPPHLDWAMQVEETFPLSSVCTSTAPASASLPPSHDTTSSEQFNLDIFYDPSAQESTCIITCNHCLLDHPLPWPVDDEYECTPCKEDLSISRDNFFIPIPSIHPVQLILTKEHFNHPEHISYFKFCLSHKIFFEKPPP